MRWRIKMVAKVGAGNLGGPYFLYFEPLSYASPSSQSSLQISTDDINKAHKYREIAAHQNSLFDLSVEEYP